MAWFFSRDSNHPTEFKLSELLNETSDFYRPHDDVVFRVKYSTRSAQQQSIRCSD
jgi:hypothetical protein